jgi:PTS system arbutin-like IIC component
MVDHGSLFMILIPVILVTAIGMSYIWPVVNSWISSLSGFILTTGLLGIFYLFIWESVLDSNRSASFIVDAIFVFTALGGNGRNWR